MHECVSHHQRERAVAAAEMILGQGGWCVLEVCADIPNQRWEPQVVIFDAVPESVADAVGEEIERQPQRDARLTGCDRRTLRPLPAMGAHLCYV